MSSVIFLQCFRNRKSAGIPRDALRKAIGPLLKEPEPDFWYIPCDAGNACTFFLEPFDAHSIHQFTVQQCCHDSASRDSLAAILGLGHVILHSPDLSAALVMDEGAIEHIKPGLLRLIGLPVVIHNGQEIRAAMHTLSSPCNINLSQGYMRARPTLTQNKIKRLLLKSYKPLPGLSGDDLLERIKGLEEDLDALVQIASDCPFMQPKRSCRPSLPPRTRRNPPSPPLLQISSQRAQLSKPSRSHRGDEVDCPL